MATYRNLHVEYNITTSPVANVWVAENYRTRVDRAGFFPRFTFSYDNAYKVMVTLTGLISSKDNPEFDQRMFSWIKTELWLRYWANRLFKPALIGLLIGGGVIVGLGLFSGLLTNTASDYFILTVAEVWYLLTWSVRITALAIIATISARIFLGQIAVFRPHFMVQWKSNTLHFSMITEADHSRNVRALPVADLQQMAWPLLLIIHQGDNDKYAAEIKAAQDAHRNYITIPNPGVRVGVYCINNTSGHYVREQPPFLNPGEDWEFSNINYFTEGSKDHARYCTAFAKYIGPWADEAILLIGVNEKTPGEQVADNHRHAYQTGRVVNFTIALLLMATSVFATKTEQVTSAIGSHTTDVPPNGARVSYVFKNKTFDRIGTGKTDIITLLNTGAGFTEDENAGQFIAVQYYGADGNKVIFANTAIPVDPVRPRPLFPAATDKADKFNLPDSARIALAADETLMWISEKKESLTKKGGYWWYVRVISWPIISLLLLPGAWFFTFSYTAGKETDVFAFYKDFFHQVHEFSAVGFYCILAIPIMYLDTEAFVQLFIESDGGFWSVIGFCIVVFGLAWLYQAIVPNRTGTNTNNRLKAPKKKQDLLGP